MKTRSLSHYSVTLILAILTGGPRVHADEVLHLDIARSNSNVIVTWTNVGTALETSLLLTGGWNELTGAVSPRVFAPTNLASFFRLRATNTPVSFDFRYLPPTFNTSIGDPFGCGCVSPENPKTLGAVGGAQDNGMGSVLPQTGELTQDAVDLEIPGRGFNWRFERRYRNGMIYDGPMGQGWDFNYNRRLAVETNGNVLCISLGRVDRYSLNTNGTFNSPSGFYTQLKRNLDGTFEESDRHGTTNFYSAANTLGIAKLTRISDRNTDQMTFQYNSVGQLSNVVDTLSRSIAYRYDSKGRLTNVTDFAGRALGFTYNSTDDLASATSPTVTGTPNGNDFPVGKTTLYTYSSGFADARLNHNLLSITAPNEAAVSGPARLVAQYDTNPASTNADRLISLRLGGTNGTGVAAGGTIFYTYTSFGAAGTNDFTTPVFENTVTNRNGNVTQYRFNILGNVVRKVQFTRGIRAGDPAGYTNSFTYNSDGEEIAQTNAELASVQFTYDSANPNRLAQGNLLQTRSLPGPRGADQSQLVTSSTYETNFNFVASVTDARSNIMTFKYDAQGNRTNVVHRIGSIVEDFAFNAFGQMTSHKLPDNGSGSRRLDVMTYYTNGPQAGYLQQSIADSGGFNLTTTYQYDSVGNLIRTVDARGYDSTNIVNQLNQIVRQVSRETTTGSGIRYQTDTFYDANNNVVQIDVQNRDVFGAIPAGNPAFTTLVAFDILNNTVTTLQEIASGYITNQFRYDPDCNLTNRLFGEAANGNQPSNAFQNLYDERDLLFRQIRGSGTSIASTTQTDYDDDGQLIRTIQGLESEPRTNTIARDGFDRQAVFTDALGNTTTNHFDANGNLTSRRTDGQTNDVAGSAGNVRLSEVSYTYDAMDRPTVSDTAFFDTETQANLTDGQVTLLTFYNDNSRVIRTVDDNNHTNSISYDTANRRLTVTDAKANTVTYAYDNNNNVTNVGEVDKSDLGSPNQTFVTRHTYDGLDRLTQTVDNISNTNRSAYDSRGNPILLTDARGNVVSNNFDRVSRLTRTTRFLTSTGDGSGTVTNSIFTRKIYDDSSRMTQQIDDNGNTTTYTYDGLNRQTRTTYADGTFISFAYDVHDNRISQTDPKVNVVTSKYDLLNRLTTNSIVRGTTVLGVTNEVYQYDGLSRVVRAQNTDSVVTRIYSSLSQVLRESQQVLPGGPVRTVACTYDGDGNQLSCTYPGGRTVNWTYDSLDRKQNGTDAGGTNAAYSYIGPFRVERRDYGNGTRMLMDYDSIRRLTNKVARVVASGTNIDSRSFTWDRASNMTAHNDLLPSAQDSRTYAYDSVNRLIQSAIAGVGPTNIYALDGVGNRIIVITGTNIGAYTLNSAAPPEDFQMNQYTTTPFDLRTNDVNGNLIAANGAAGLRLFSYDYRDRLISYANSSITVNNKYDCFGRRIEKAGNSATNRFYYSGWQEIEEQDGANATLATYVYGNGIDELLTTDRGGQRRFFHEDYAGSIRKVTDNTGTIVEQYRYDDYGLPTFLNGAGTVIPTSQITNATLFTGRRYDGETGLHYYRTRYLDSAAGRFITRDSIGIWGDLENIGNGYAYVANNPLRWTDPIGLTKFEISGAGCPAGSYSCCNAGIDFNFGVASFNVGGEAVCLADGTKYHTCDAGGPGTKTCSAGAFHTGGGNNSSSGWDKAWNHVPGTMLTFSGGSTGVGNGLDAVVTRPSSGLGATLSAATTCPNRGTVGTSTSSGTGSTRWGSSWLGNLGSWTAQTAPTCEILQPPTYYHATPNASSPHGFYCPNGGDLINVGMGWVTCRKDNPSLRTYDNPSACAQKGGTYISYIIGHK